MSWRRIEDVLKMSWRRFCKCLEDVFANVLKTFLQKTFWRRLENVLTRRLKDVLKTSWRSLQNVLTRSWRRLEDVFARRLGKMSWRRLENEYIRLDQYVLKTSSGDEDERRLQDFFIKTNVCWDSATIIFHRTMLRTTIPY